MTATRRSFLASIGLAAVSPGIVGRAVAAPRRIYPPVSLPVLWMRQCGWKGNPAWIFYDMLVAQYGADAFDRESCARMAAYCDEPVADSS